MGLKEEWAKVDALRNSDTQELSRRDEPTSEMERKEKNRKTVWTWEPGKEEAPRGRQWSTQ